MIDVQSFLFFIFDLRLYTSLSSPVLCAYPIILHVIFSLSFSPTYFIKLSFPLCLKSNPQLYCLIYENLGIFLSSLWIIIFSLTVLSVREGTLQGLNHLTLGKICFIIRMLILVIVLYTLKRLIYIYYF